jgi:hypothetical protein
VLTTTVMTAPAHEGQGREKGLEFKTVRAVWRLSDRSCDLWWWDTSDCTGSYCLLSPSLLLNTSHWLNPKGSQRKNPCDMAYADQPLGI